MKAAFLVVAGALLVGCSTSNDGSPGPSAASLAPTSSSASTSAAAPRPRTFDLTGVDPCELIPTSARPALKLDRPPSGPNPAGSAKQCAFPSTTSATFGIFVDSTENVAAALGSGGTIINTSTTDGFTATFAAPPGGFACEAFLDVNDGQYVSVQATASSTLSQDQLCALVKPGIKVVLDTLAKLQPK